MVISCDLNYRHSLWEWGESPSTVMSGLVEQCDLLAANTDYLMLMLAHIITRHSDWKDAKIRLLRVIRKEANEVPRQGQDKRLFESVFKGR